MKKDQAYEHEEVHTIVGRGATFEGNAHIEGNLWIEGTLHGHITCLGTVTIAQNGSVDASLRARDIVIGGTVKGEVGAENRVTLQSSARVQGKLSATVLIVEEGAALRGDCDIGKDNLSFSVLPQESLVMVSSHVA